MDKEELNNLLNTDKCALQENTVSDDILKQIDVIILNSFDSGAISEDVFNIYKKFVAMKHEAPDSMKSELFRVMNNYVHEKLSNKEYYDALLLYRFLIVKLVLGSNNYFDIAELLNYLQADELCAEFLNLYLQKEKNRPLVFITLANFYNLTLHDYKKAIRYYEKYLEIDKTKPVVYTIVGSLYAKLYGDLSLKDQIFYFQKAYNLKPSDRLILHGLAFAYEKLGDKEKAQHYYQKLLENNPTETDYYNYGAFLISCGDFVQGHKYFAHRFFVDDENLKYPLDNLDCKWDFKSDISKKTLLVHFEQGFGDTFMYCRYVPFLKKFANKVIFVVQDALYDLIKSSSLISEGVEVVSDKEDITKLSYDVHMALLDAPLVLEADIYNIPYSAGYLSVDENKVKSYREKYINNSKSLKVGIAYSGDKSANYNGRDIEINRFKNLLKIDGIDFYSLQVGGNDEVVSNLKSLGSTFNNFTDTACAIKNMDIVISTDNVILNLSGALGVKTYGLFNKYPNFRWYKLNGDNVGWYEKVVPIQVEENNCWRDVFSELTKILVNISSNR